MENLLALLYHRRDRTGIIVLVIGAGYVWTSQLQALLLAGIRFMAYAFTITTVIDILALFLLIVLSGFVGFRWTRT